MSLEDQKDPKRFMDLEILVNRLQEKVKDLETLIKEYPEIHRSGCPFSDFKGDVVGKFREITDGLDKCKAEIYGTIATNKSELLTLIAANKSEQTTANLQLKRDTEKDVEAAKSSSKNSLAIVTTILVVIIGITFGLSQDKVSSQSFHESISILNKTQERQLEIYERLLQDLNQLKVDTGIIKNKIDVHVGSTEHVPKSK